MACPDCGGAGMVTVDMVIGREIRRVAGVLRIVDVTEPAHDACRRCAAAAEAAYQSGAAEAEYQSRASSGGDAA